MAKPRNRNRVNAKGRNTTSRFTRLDHRILTSNAYRALSPNARSLLVELIMLYNGSNNGSLYLSVKDAAHRMGVADVNAARQAFADLERLGFIELTHDAHFHVKASERSRARCWRLTWEAGPGRKPPSWDFLEREAPPKSRERKRMERGQKALKKHRKAKASGNLPVLDSNTLTPKSANLSASPVLQSNTLKPENGGILPK